MKQIKAKIVDEKSLDLLLGIESSKIGFYGEVKQKIKELESANLGLRTKKAELQAVFDSISDGVVIYDSSGLVQQRNHIVPRLFPTETLLGKSCRALFHPDRVADRENCPVGRALMGDSFHTVLSIARNGGANHFYDVTATPLEGPSGERRALLFLRDVTERRSRELNLLQSEKMASIGLLAAGIAHEINNPMTSVAGYAEALQRRLRDVPELSEDPRMNDFPNYLEVIVREVYRCKLIIESLLSFSRKSDGLFGKVNINTIIKEVLELVRHQGRDKKIALKENFLSSLPDVLGDASALRQVFLNLVLNAFQAIDREGLIVIETFVNDAYVCAKVIDNGTGIAPEVLEQIWNPFYTTKKVGKNQGLGLAITYDIVKKHEGTIMVNSKQGVGTEFIVRLPKCQEK
jgi:two-component system NtrC family sensor kinase